MSTGEQLALSLFEDLAAVGGTIQHAPKDLGYQRNNIFIDIADLSLVARRAIDVAYFLVAEEPEIKKVYEVDLNFFRWLAAYPSTNRKHFRSVLREGQKAAIQLESADQSNPSEMDRWASVPLLGSVGIDKGTLFFEVHEKLQRHIKNPKTSHFLSLKFVFNSLHAKIIYDRLLLFVEDGVTPWYDLDSLKTWLGCASKTYDQFKYLKRNVLDKAIEQINEISDLEVKYDTKNVPGSKRVGHVRFRVKSTAVVGANKAAMLILKGLYDTLKQEFGFSDAQLDKVLQNRAQWTDERILQAMDYTRFQLARGKIKQTPSGYLLKALEKGLAVGEADRILMMQQQGLRPTLPLPAPNATQGSVQAPTAQHADLVHAADVQRTEQARLGYAVFEKMNEQEQARMLETFAATPAAAIIARRLKTEPKELGALVTTNDWVRNELGSFIVSTYRTKNAHTPRARRQAKQQSPETQDEE